MLGFLKFKIRVGVGNDAGPGVEVDGVVLADGGADGNAPEALAIEAESTDGAGVKAAGVALELGDDFGGALFGGTRDGASGETGAKSLGMTGRTGESAFHRGDEVKDLWVGFNLPQFRNVDAAELADLTEVVALEVGDHEEFGTFFWGGQQIGAGMGIMLGVKRVAGTGTFDGASDNAATAEAKKKFRGRGQHLGASQIEISRVRGRRDLAEAEITGKGIGPIRPGRLPRVSEVDLINVSRGDVSFGRDDAFDEVGAGRLGCEMQAGGRGGGWREGLLEVDERRQPARFEPSAGIVEVKQGVWVVTQGEVAVVTDPPEQTPRWEWPVGVMGQGVLLEVVFDLLPVGMKVAREDFQGARGQQRNGSGPSLSTVEPKETREVGEAVSEVFGADSPGTVLKRRGGAVRSWNAEVSDLKAGPVNH